MYGIMILTPGLLGALMGLVLHAGNHDKYAQDLQLYVPTWTLVGYYVGAIGAWYTYTTAAEYHPSAIALMALSVFALSTGLYMVGGYIHDKWHNYMDYKENFGVESAFAGIVFSACLALASVAYTNIFNLILT